MQPAPPTATTAATITTASASAEHAAEHPARHRRSGLARSRPVLHRPVQLGNEDLCRHTDKDSGLHNARQRPNLGIQPRLAVGTGRSNHIR